MVRKAGDFGHIAAHNEIDATLATQVATNAEKLDASALDSTFTTIDANPASAYRVQADARQNATYARVLKPEKYGAIGDGVADDTAALLAMLADMSNGSAVKGSQGATYRHTAPLTVSAVDDWTWDGGGFRYDDSAASVAGAGRAISISNCKRFRFANVYVDVVNQAQQQSGVVVLGGSRDGLLENVYVFNARWTGIAISTATQNITVQNCSGIQCRFGAYSTGPGAKILGGTYEAQWDLTQEYIDKGGVWDATSLYYDGIIIGGSGWSIIGTTCTKNGQSGIYCGLGSDGVISGNQVSDNYNKGIDLGIVGTKGVGNIIERVTVTDNVVTNNLTGQIHFYGVDNSVISNNVAEAAVDSVSAAVILNINSNNNLISNNHVRHLNPSIPAVWVDPVATGNLVAFNLVTATVKYSVSSTNNILITSSTGLDIISKMTTRPYVDVSAQSGFAGRDVLQLIGSADNAYVQITTNDKEVRFVNGAGVARDVVVGKLISSSATLSGTTFFADAAVIRLPITATSQVGSIHFDNTANTIRYRDNTSTKTLATTLLQEVNTTGLTSAQIDALVPNFANGMRVSDPTNSLILIRQAGKWYKSAAYTLIA